MIVFVKKNYNYECACTI